jgi:hypothetical protein
VCGVKETDAMDRNITEIAIKIILSEMSQRLKDASGIAQAAEHCAQAGNIDKAVEIALDIEQLAYEAGRLLDAASLLNRISKE